MRLWRTFAAALLVLASAVASFGQQQDQNVVTAKPYLSTSALKPRQDFKLAVKFSVKEGYHIGAAVPKAAYPSKLTLKAPAGITFTKPKYPKEVMRPFAFADNELLPVYEGEFTIFVDGKVAKNAVPGSKAITATLVYQACDATTCSMPASVTVTLKTRVVKSSEKVAPANPSIFAPPPAAGSAQASKPASGIEGLFQKSAFFGFLMIFVLGIGLCLTPCVYPMVPVTIGYFGMQAEKKGQRLVLLALTYVIGIAITYSILGVLAARTGAVFGAALQNPFVPGAIAVVLIALALSMFGLYELRPPNWLAAKSQGRTGAIGALIMGLLFGVVAAPCVGPVTVGLLVFVAKVGKPIFGFLTFFTLALGMGAPLFVLAMSAGAINRLPQAGMWMVTVKKVFGLLLIGAALYYLTPLVRTHVSPKVAEAVLPIFIMVSGLYIGWLETSLRKVKGLRAPRKIVGLGLLVLGLTQVQPARTATPMPFQPYSEAAVTQALKSGKPVVIDFTAAWCAACKELEEKTFPDAGVRKEGDRFVRLRVDLTNENNAVGLAAKQKYSVLGLPTIVFVSPDGTEVKDARIVGFVPPKDMLSRMRSVK